MDLRADEIEVVEHLVRLRIPRGAIGHDRRGGGCTTARAPADAGAEIVRGDADAEERSGILLARGALGGDHQAVRSRRRGRLRATYAGRGENGGSNQQMT